MSQQTIYTTIFLILLTISTLFFFDVFRIDMEDKSVHLPAYFSGEPTNISNIKERMEPLEMAMCSGSAEGVEVVKKAIVGQLKKIAYDADADALIDLTVSYGQHETLHPNCPHGVIVSGTPVKSK